MPNLTPDSNANMGLGDHITGGASAPSGAAKGPSASMAWILIVGAVLLLFVFGVGLRKVRI